jgi:hypothetical protein
MVRARRLPAEPVYPLTVIAVPGCTALESYPRLKGFRFSR